MDLPDGIQSLPNVCEVLVRTSPGHKPGAPSLLFELPHGATTSAHYTRVRSMLVGQLPEDLTDYFFVNTDVGSTEYALRTADRIVCTPGPPRSVLIIRCLIPRTFIDTNRIPDAKSSDARDANLTMALPEYIRAPEDAATLTEMYHSYHAVVRKAYDWVCGSGGLAMTAHTYAPRSIHIETFDEGIGRALRAAYEPDAYADWPVRPEVDVITHDPDGVDLSPHQLVRSLMSRFEQSGIETAQNATYELHPVSMAYHYSALYPQQVLCLEVSRGILAEPFDPFGEMNIGAEKIERVAEPLAAAFCEALRNRDN